MLVEGARHGEHRSISTADVAFVVDANFVVQARQAEFACDDADAACHGAVLGVDGVRSCRHVIATGCGNAAHGDNDGPFLSELLEGPPNLVAR